MAKFGGNVWYTVWDAHTDDVLAFGDAATCAGMLGTTLNSFYTTVSRVVSGEYRHWVVLKEKNGGMNNAAIYQGQGGRMGDGADPGAAR